MDDDNRPMYLTKEAIENLNDKLCLPDLGPFSQDWEYELANSSRILEFITYYEQHDLSKDEKCALMALVISCLDDYLSEGRAPGEIWNKIRYYLLKENEIYINKIRYWSLEEEDLENCFSVTPLMREVIEQMRENVKNDKID